MEAILLLAQAVAGPVLAPPARSRSDAPCPVVADSEDVVVCGRTDDRFRLLRLPEAAMRDGVPQAQMRVGNATLAAEAEQATLTGGQQSQRLMLRLKIPMGGKKRD